MKKYEQLAPLRRRDLSQPMGLKLLAQPLLSAVTDYVYVLSRDTSDFLRKLSDWLKGGNMVRWSCS